MVSGRGYEQLIGKNLKTLEKNPPLIDRRRVFSCPQPIESAIRITKIMTTLNEDETLSREERFVALAHTYLEFHLSLQSAIDAAEADLLQLDGSELVAEAA
ncbi:MAG: hypothetical protein JO070_11815 [Verrucomicrobia bacterium]|nr:hypothetical protein [Verrucomicrobiota bacterium]